MAKWDNEQLANARLIVAVGLEMGMSSRDITVGLMAAMQESGLRNLSGGMSDSIGLFQQRPSQGWGSVSQITNPLYSTRKFFSRLQSVGNRNNLSLGGAAQAVQRSAYPGRYANWEADATRLTAQLGMKTQLPFPLQRPQMDLDDIGYLSPKAAGISAPTSEQGTGAPGAGVATETPQAPQQPAPATDVQAFVDDALKGVQSHVDGIRGKLIDSAMGALGTPYVWGGVGPSGYDCSGLIWRFYNKLGVKVPRVAHDQAAVGQRAPIQSLLPGDFIGFNPDVHHIAIYLGGGRILEAPHTGAKVRIRTLGKGENAFGVHLNLPGGGESVKAPSLAGLEPAATPPLLAFPGLTSSGEEEEEGI